jgi:hypothetical protein
MYLSPGTWVRFPRKAKIPLVKGGGEDREVAVSGAPKAQAVTPSPHNTQQSLYSINIKPLLVKFTLIGKADEKCLPKKK